MLPDHTDSHKEVGHEVGDLLWADRLEALAGLVQRFEELEVVAGLLRFVLDVQGQIGEAFGIGAIDPLQELDDLLEFWLLELFVNVLEVLPPSPPIVDFL